MPEQHDKYTKMDVTKVYEKDLPDKIASCCDNCGSLKFKSSLGEGKSLRKCTDHDMKKNIED
ncbi:hypothetical protein [Priestia megaterium]|uniref:hypothetical protein n=1 Tax=Priestia megaterium TaxID=1404 RepID=UPI0036718232